MERMDVLRPLNLREGIFRPREVECDLGVQCLLSPSGHGRESKKRLGCLTASPRYGWSRWTCSTRESESPGHPLQMAAADGDHVEGDLEAGRLRMASKPGVGRDSEPTLLLVIHHLERVAESLAQLLLHLAEDQPPPSADDDVELVAGDPGVRRQDSVPAHAVPPDGALLGPLTGTQRHNSR